MAPYAPAKAAKILVIEDSREVRMSFVAACEDEGYEVYSASDGFSGLAEFSRRSPDLVLTDLRMPGISGIDVVTEVRKRSDVPVIVITAIGDSQTRDACLTAGASDFLVKGNSIDELIIRVQRQLRPLGL